MFDTILLAIDGSKQTEYVVELACTLAAGTAATVFVTCCVDVAYALNDPSPADEQVSDYAPAQYEEGSAQALVHQTVEKLRTRSVNAVSNIIVGTPELALVEEARNKSASVILMGHRHQSPLGRLLTGSVSAEVIAHSPCPVLVEVRGNLA
jgi:nucleotide-binding universal stress UspA family protein